jgi:hypothetical protein
VTSEEREHVTVMSREFVELRSSYRHHEGTNDYTNSGTEIVEIVDRHGQSVQPVWKSDWTTLDRGSGVAPGRPHPMRSHPRKRMPCARALAQFP